MTAMPHAPLTQEEILPEGVLALETPEGFRAELIEGEIVVTPPPDGDYGDYREQHRVPFGKSLALPEPFGFDVETADFG